MSALKKKDLTAQSQENAAFLPELMRAAAPTMDIYPVELEKLQPAPAQWNFYKPLSDSKMVELISSIENNGLLHPIVVWQTAPDSYMILSGHNRVNAYKHLRRRTNDPNYNVIGCCVRRDLDEAAAREIIIDSNWVQRSLSVTERTQSIYQKYVLAGRKQRGKNGEGHLRTYDMIAEEYGLSGRQIHRYVKLGSLLPELLAKVDQGAISFTTGVKLAGFPTEIQQLLNGELSPYLNNKTAQKLRKEMSAGTVRQILTGQAEDVRAYKKTVCISLKVPAHLKDSFVKMANDWLNQQP